MQVLGACTAQRQVSEDGLSNFLFSTANIARFQSAFVIRPFVINQVIKTCPFAEAQLHIRSTYFDILTVRDQIHTVVWVVVVNISTRLQKEPNKIILTEIYTIQMSVDKGSLVLCFGIWNECGILVLHYITHNNPHKITYNKQKFFPGIHWRLPTSDISICIFLKLDFFFFKPIA